MQEKKGLTSSEAKKRLSKYGSNELKGKKRANPLKIFISQFTSPLILLLIFAALISWGIGFLPGQDANVVDTVLILIIVFVSGLSGFSQDYKAEKTIEALQKIATPQATVVRDNREIKISILEVVPGDLVLIEEGDVIPADCKLIKSFNLEVDESVLTGESKAVNRKDGEEIFKGTFINSGNAQALVLKTGINTKIGKIADKLEGMVDEKTSFQIEMTKFSKKIFFVTMGIVVLLFFVSLLKYNVYESMLTSISLAVAAIPEGLPAVLVLVLALGAKVMSNKNALVRKLNVVESAGAIDVICTDKTGTLTENEMKVVSIFSNDKVLDLSRGGKIDIKKANQLLLCGSLCNNSKIGYKDNKKIYLGDQTEIALKKISDEFSMGSQDYKKIGELSFTSKRKMMSVICKKKNSSSDFVFTKGAPEVLIKNCNRVYLNGKIVKINEKMKKKILEQNKDFASQALRVLGFAFKETSSKKDVENKKDVEKNLVWLGLQAMRDPPRKEVKQALENCDTAGIRVIMLTGDNPITAKAIADEIGLKSTGFMSGKDLDKISDKKLREKLNSGVNIFSRISPFHKLKILELLKKDYRVAMTGDGVNDALAIKKADVGISVGDGTEVTKQASDIILLDNNFASIIGAVKEGRRSFDNIRKFINYLFVSNLAEVGVLFLATLFLTLREPILLPIQILWINLLTDGFPALALGADPARADIMEEPPRKKGEHIINKRLAWLIGTIGVKKMILLFITFFLVEHFSGVEQARTALFTGFILYEFVRIGSIRYQEKLSWFSNKWLLIALVGSVLLQLLIVYTPLSSFFHIEALGLFAWMILIIGIIVGYVAAILITKIVMQLVKD